ncbi:MAG: hypothetical protein KDK30_11735 [Leptospiraceae bacterium]|nr:hypothetical protein [Leptospiraceae bacterium]MCB1315007.1 hypothetical protein [Leptospiraceae bacterium]
MALTERGSGWEWLQSWWILLTLPMGLTSGFGFIYAGIRAGRKAWVIIGIIYAALIYVPAFWLLKPDESGPYDSILGFMFFGIWIISIIHALIIRKSFILNLDARLKVGQKDLERQKTEIALQHDISDNRIDEALIRFNKDDVTVKMCGMIFSAMPFAPDFRFYFNLKGAAERYGATPEQYERARKLAHDDDVISALKVASALDTADSGIGIFTGAKNIYDHMKEKEGRRTFEADPQQAADAGLKLLGMAYMISQLFPGGIIDKSRTFFDLKAGKELAVYYAAAEIALPFTDNLLEAGGNWMEQLWQRTGDDNESKFMQFMGEGPLARAKPIMESIKSQIDSFLAQARMYTDPLLKKAQAFAPTVMNAADSITGGAATAIDFLPAWRFLGARLAAEACVYRAMHPEAEQQGGR